MVTLLVVILLVGLLLWLIHSVIPMDANVRKILDVVVILLLVLYILSAFGVLPWPWPLHLK